MIFNCIKCNRQYDVDDDEAYLCEGCVNAKNAIAKRIDAQRGVPAPVISNIQRFDEKARDYKGIKLVNANEL